MAGIKAMGAKLAYTVGSEGEKFIAHLTSLGALKINNSEIDVTDHDSPDGKKEYIAGDQEYDNVSFSGNGLMTYSGEIKVSGVVTYVATPTSSN